MDHEEPLAGVTLAVTTDALTLRVTGVLDAESAVDVRARFQAAVATLPPPSLIIVDLMAVELVTAAGLRLLETFASASKAAGLRVHLVAAPDGMPMRVIEIAGLHQGIPTFPTVHDAQH